MASQNEVVGPARVQYGDWSGSAAADSADAGGASALFEAVGLDTKRWWVLSLDVAGPELQNDGVYIYALDRLATGVSNYAELQSYVAEHGEAPVTSFLVHDISVETIVRELFKRFALNLRSRSVTADTILRVHERNDLNYQGD